MGFKRKSERTVEVFDPYDIPDGTLLVDLSQIAMSIVSETFNPRDLITEVDVESVIFNTIRTNIKRFKDNYPEVVICIDSKQKYWRLDHGYYYKGTRKLNRTKTGLDYETIFKGLANVIGYLKTKFPYKVIEVDRIEADDTIGYLARELCQTRKVMIVSADGDFTQLHNRNIKQYSPMLKKQISHKYGSGRKDLLVKIIKGDRKDCISNIKSVSDHLLVNINGGARQKSISAKFLQEVMDDPETACTKEEYIRFQENEKMLNLSLTPVEYTDKIQEEYQIMPIGTEADIFKLFMSKGWMHLLGKVKEFC
jgi:5'-3' exonuclease